MSKAETVCAALFAAIETPLKNTGYSVYRNTPFSQVVGNGLVIVRDGDPGAPVEITLNPTTRYYEHRASIEFITEASTPDACDAAFDALKVAIGAALYADLSLGGVVDYLEAQAPAPSDPALDEGKPQKAATLNVLLHYEVEDENPLI